MKIICATHFFPPSIGGMQLSNYLLVEGLAKLGHDIELIVFNSSGECDQIKGVKTHYFNLDPNSITGIYKFAKIILTNVGNFDPSFVFLLDSNMERGFGLLPKRNKSFQKTRFVAINSGSFLSRSENHLKAKINKFLVMRSSNWLDFIFISKSSSDIIKSKYPQLSAKINEIGRPIPDNYFVKTKKEPIKLFKNKLPILFSCSRAVEEKGISLIIKAISNLRDKNGREVVNFLFAGDGKDLCDWKNLVERHNLKNVMLLGELPFTKMIDYYDQCYFFILPSHYPAAETFGRSWVEAMARSKPIISTNTANLKNIIKDDYNGILVEPTIESIEIGIDKALKVTPYKYKLLSENAKNYALEYKQSRIIKHLLNTIYNKTKFQSDKVPL